MAEEVFLSLVQNRKCLYDKKDTNFKNTSMKEREWQIIGATFQMTGNEAQVKFKALRQKYIREKNVINTETRSGAGASQRTKWPLMKYLEFLDDHIKSRKVISNLTFSSCLPSEKEQDTSEDILIASLVNTEETEDDTSEDWSERVEMLEQCFVESASETPSTSTPKELIDIPTSPHEPVKKRSRPNRSKDDDNITDLISKLAKDLEKEEKTEEAQARIKPHIKAFGTYLMEQLNRLPDNTSDYLMAKINNLVSQKVVEELYKE